MFFVFWKKSFLYVRWRREENIFFGGRFTANLLHALFLSREEKKNIRWGRKKSRKNHASESVIIQSVSYKSHHKLNFSWRKKTKNITRVKKKMSINFFSNFFNWNFFIFSRCSRHRALKSFFTFLYFFLVKEEEINKINKRDFAVCFLYCLTGRKKKKEKKIKWMGKICGKGSGIFFLYFFPPTYKWHRGLWHFQKWRENVCIYILFFARELLDELPQKLIISQPIERWTVWKWRFFFFFLRNSINLSHSVESCVDRNFHSNMFEKNFNV